MYLVTKNMWGAKILKDPQTGNRFVFPKNKFFALKSTREGLVFFADKTQITGPISQLAIDSHENLVCLDVNKLNVKINPDEGNYTPQYDLEITSKHNYGFSYLITKLGEMYKCNQRNLTHFKTDMTFNPKHLVKLSKSSPFAYVIKKELHQSTKNEAFGVMDVEGGFLTPFVFDSNNIKVSVSPDWYTGNNEKVLLGFQEGSKNILTYSAFGEPEIIDELPLELSYTYLSSKEDKSVIIAGHDFKTQKTTVMTYVPKSELVGEHNKSFVKVDEAVYDGYILKLLKQESNHYKKLMVVERAVDGKVLKGIIDEQGKEVFPVVCEKIDNYSNCEILIQKEGETYYYNISTGVLTSEKERQKEVQQKYFEYLEYEKKQKEKQQKQDEAFEKWLDGEIEIDVKDYTAEDYTNFGYLHPEMVKMTRREYIEYLKEDKFKGKEATEFAIRQFVSDLKKQMHREFLKTYKPEDQPGNE